MRFKLLTLIILTSPAGYSQLINTTLSDSILYNVVNYVQTTTQQANNIYTVVYNNISNPAYQMKKMYMDSARSKLLSTTYYYQDKLYGPHESYKIHIQASTYLK